MLTEKQQTIINILKVSGCITVKDISNLAIRRHNAQISAASAAGTLRPWIARGLAANADNGMGGKVYWLTDYGKEYFK